MYWNRPQLVPYNAGSGGGAGAQPQPPPPNPLVLNRQNNTAGLWNGGMAEWNSIFVELPPETFNPVKSVMDLLR